MKKLILTAAAVACAASVFAQGTIVFNNRVAGQIITHVYAPLSSAPGTSQIGNAATGDLPVGTTSWAGYTLIGTALTGQYGGSATMAQLLSGPAGTAESSLVPQPTAIATFRTGAAAGWINGGITATLSNVGENANAVLEMVAWDNSSGLYSTWTLASVAWKNGLIAAGKSGAWSQAVAGGTFTPPNMVGGASGVQSFNLYVVPEPSTFALAGLGMAALLVFRRRK